MASQAAVKIFQELELSDGRTEVRFALTCGCEVTVALDEHRLITAVDGARLVIGKYPCPNGHPVTRP